MTTTTLSDTVLRIDTGDGVEVSVDTGLLREHNWIPQHDADEHCGHDLDEAHEEGRQEGLRAALREGSEGEAGQALHQFHDDTHQGAYKFCYERPCREIREALG